MGNFFKNAYFGKPYKTTDNTIVKFILQRYEDDFIIYIPKCKYSIETTHRYNSKGEFYLGNGEYGHGALDIVSEWQPISDEELDKMAHQYCEDCRRNSKGWIATPNPIDSFKAGCKEIFKRLKQ